MFEGSDSGCGKSKIAYFTMEIGLENDVSTYAGGLGILAGDILRSCADLRLPMVAVTLVSKKGYFKQDITPDGKQIANPDEWDPTKFMQMLPVETKVRIQNRDVIIKAWLYNIRSSTGGSAPVILLDTDVEGNAPEDREITSFLYGGDERYRLKQEIVLGVGGVRMLEALGFGIRKYHMNEGHSSLLTLELLRKCGMNPQKVREQCLFTTHTPVEAAHDKFPYDLVKDIMGETDLDALRRFGGQQRLNMTLLALNLSGYVNGVAKRHRDTTKEIFPAYAISYITNGAHSCTWTCKSFRDLYDRYIPGWANEPELLVRVDLIPDEEIWRAHLEAKRSLIDYVNNETDVGMDFDKLTVGYAKRITGYKRANLLFSDVEKLKALNRVGEIQIIFAGKAHPRDETGKCLIEQMSAHIEKLRGEMKIAYLKNYNMSLAAKLVSGVDVWLNTPLRPLEASGTSGMKAAHNGVINFSVLDGWWVEGCIEGVTGWSIGPQQDGHVSINNSCIIEMENRHNQDTDDLYNKLEYTIIPMFYGKRDEWIKMMKNSIGKIAYYFNSRRMVRRYFTEAYL